MMESRAISQRTVARQDNAPADTSLLWLDSSFDPAVLKTYNNSSSEWQTVGSSVVSKQDTAPQSPADGDLWQDTSVSPAVLRRYVSATATWEVFGRDQYQNPRATADITRSVDQNETTVPINCRSYTVEAGTTVTASQGLIAVFATEKITINGTIDGMGLGATGGAGGAANDSGNKNPGQPGGRGYLTPVLGGAGGGGSGGGGDGGDGGTTVYNDIQKWGFGEIRPVIDNVRVAGPGGGGGASGKGLESNSGGNGSAPGGGGGTGGYNDSSVGAGGDGGDGGAGLILVAPQIEITGTIDLRGTDGQPGQDDVSAGGGGGGGSGGVIVARTQYWKNTGTLNLSGGAGGVGGAGNNGYDGGDGAAGADGEVIRI